MSSGIPAHSGGDDVVAAANRKAGQIGAVVRVEWSRGNSNFWQRMNVKAFRDVHVDNLPEDFLLVLALGRLGLELCIPWDEQFLVESLSDSTLYMAYYTFAHLLHNEDMYGTSRSPVAPDQLTDKMKQEFEYWNPSPLISEFLSQRPHHAPFRKDRPSPWETLEHSARQSRSSLPMLHEFSLADAGDGVDDANFVFETPNAAIL
ncbi:hypothetical protein TIFTF001_008190 [Ficus carica]|uniref:Uncharacterized protein n=1 Tax=Ficus carica TaxID=3494 RepID=A0AA88D0B7_FICCA|nr:hypothetical protein TIFTF001_008190 [Ficus carica]